MKHVLTFVGTFLVGALIALAARTATHDPHRDHPATPAAQPDHASHAATPQPKAQAASTAPVNSVCAICGMKVDPSVPTLEYQGKKIGFGCRMCPPKFKADPDKYGPYYLRNEVMPK